MRHEIRPSMWESIYYEDWEISKVVVFMKGVPMPMSYEIFYQDIVWGTAAIECWDVTSCYRIIRAEKKWKLLEIELWDSTLRHRR